MNEKYMKLAIEEAKKAYENDSESVKKYANVLYTQALLIEGFPIENPVEFSNMMCELMIKSAKY